MSLFSLAFWAIVVPWLQYLPEIHFAFLMRLWIKRYKSKRSLLCCHEVSLMMYNVLSSLRPESDLSCQCAVQCTVILILLPVGHNVVHTFGSPLWWWWWWCCCGWQWWWWWCSLIWLFGNCFKSQKRTFIVTPLFQTHWILKNPWYSSQWWWWWCSLIWLFGNCLKSQTKTFIVTTLFWVKKIR